MSIVVSSLVSVKELAELWNCSERHIFRLVDSGKLRPAHDIGAGKRRILRFERDVTIVRKKNQPVKRKYRWS